jgi:hypothetical protein
MTDAFQNPHPAVPFASVGDDTVAALADLAAIFKLKVQPTPSHAPHASPTKVAQLLASHHWSQLHHATSVIHPTTGKEMEYASLMKDPRLQPLWSRGFGNECGRLFQGIRDIPGTDTCVLVTLKSIPNDRKITYGKIVCDYKPHK